MIKREITRLQLIEEQAVIALCRNLYKHKRIQITHVDVLVFRKLMEYAEYDASIDMYVVNDKREYYKDLTSLGMMVKGYNYIHCIYGKFEKLELMENRLRKMNILAIKNVFLFDYNKARLMYKTKVWRDKVVYRSYFDMPIESGVLPVDKVDYPIENQEDTK